MLVLALTAGFAVVAWSGIEQWQNAGGDDAYAYRDYVQWLDKQHRIPRRDQNYEYALPIGVPAVGLAVQRAFGAPNLDKPTSPPLQVLPNMLRRALWVALVALGGLAFTRRGPTRLVGAGLWLAAAAWAAAYVVAATDNEWWLPLVLVSYVSGVALVPASAWLAHEVWPERQEAPVLGGLGAVLLPPIFASTLYFHPDPPFALLSVTATALVVRALRTGLTWWKGLLAGLVLGGTVLARQSGPLIAVALALAVVLVMRRRALPYLGAGTLGLLLVAAPWWYQQWLRYHNPIESNLNRPGYMLDHEPLSFFVSFPVQLITAPRTPHFANDLLPRFHAYLWSDYGGGYHHWGDTKRFATFLASTQSVLGLGIDLLVIGSVATIGIAAVRRREGAFTVLTSLFVLAWIAFVGTLVRFPQREGDPIKVHYLLFLAPVCIVFAIAGARALVERGGWRKTLLIAWLTAYAVSWVLTIATAF